jgi:hypothetical protein
VEQICYISPQSVENDDSQDVVSLRSSSVQDEAVLNEKTKIQRFESQGWSSLKNSPFYELLREFEDVFPDEVPAELPVEKGVRHEIDLVPGTKYCVTRQWPLPKEQVEVIDDFFAQRAKAGQVRESKSPHCSPTFCVKKATGGWRIVHAFNKLNSATVPAQTPIPRKDVILDSMQGSTIFSTIDLRDGYYQILMREKDIPLTAVSTPSGMLWEWLVMPQGLSNAPATFNRCVSQLFRSCRNFAPCYFDDIFIHSKSEANLSEVQVHTGHLREVLSVMRKYKLYANIKKCIFGAPEIPVLGCFVGRNGVRADPEKIKAIVDWPVPQNVKELRQWLGIANYLHKYTKNYADIVRPLSALLRKDEAWIWTPERDDAFNNIKKSLTQAPILALPNHEKPFHVVCDASDFAIGCALLQYDDEGKERVISYQSRQLRPPERNYPVHDKELLAMKFALVKFRIYLLGSKPFTVYTDHASLRTAIKSPHLSQRMARWLSFFAEYNFNVEYKPGKLNFIGDGLSRRPDLDFKTKTSSEVNAITCVRSSLMDDIKTSYEKDITCNTLLKYFNSDCKDTSKLDSKSLSRLHRFSFSEGLIYYSIDHADDPRILVPNDVNLKEQILYEYHDSPISGHLGREKTFLAVSRDFYWPHLYKWVRKYVRTCEICQRVKPSGSNKAPLLSLPIARDCWRSISMDFTFGYPKDKQGRTGILVFVDRFSKMVHLVPVTPSVTAEETASIFLDTVFRLHGMPESIVSDRDPRFHAAFWRSLFQQCGTQLLMSTAAHPESDGQTERVNRVLGDILRSYATTIYKDWSKFLPMAEFAINNSVHVSHGYTPFYVNTLAHPRVPLHLGGGPSLSGGGNQEFDSSSNEEEMVKRNKRLVVSNNNNKNDQSDDQVNDQGDDQENDQGDDQEDDQSDDRDDDQLFDQEEVSAVTTRHQKRANLAQEHSSTDQSWSHLKDDVAKKKQLEIPMIPVESEKEITQAKSKVDKFLEQRQVVIQVVRDSLAKAVDQQKEQADKHGRKNKEQFIVGDKVLLSTKNLSSSTVSNLDSNKLLPRYIGPFTIVKVVNDNTFKLDIPSKMRLNPVFYQGLLKRYHDPTSPPCGEAASPDCLTKTVVPLGNSSSHEVPHSAFSSPSAACRDHGQQQRSLLRSSDRLLEVRKDAEQSLASRSRDSSNKLLSKQQVPYGTSSRCHRSSLSNGSPYSGGRQPPPIIDSEGNQRWVVDSILECRHESPSCRHYLVKWCGYPQATWVSQEVLMQDVPDLLKDFLRKRKKTRQSC